MSASLVYAESAQCPCGERMAYRDGADYWDCSGILEGTANPAVKHEAELPFVFWELKVDKSTLPPRPMFFLLRNRAKQVRRGMRA